LKGRDDDPIHAGAGQVAGYWHPPLKPLIIKGGHGYVLNP